MTESVLMLFCLAVGFYIGHSVGYIRADTEAAKKELERVTAE